MSETPMSTEETRHTREIIALVVALLLLCGLFFSVWEIVSPFVLAGALLFVLYPFRGNTLVSRLMWLAVMIFVLWFLYSLRGVLFPFAIALLAAYLLNPIVTRLEPRMPRWLSSLLAVLALVGVAVGVVLFIVPVAFRQFDQIIGRLAMIGHAVSDFVKSGEMFNILGRFGIPVDEARDLISTELSPRIEVILKTIFQGVFGFVSSISSLVMHVLNAVIIPFIIFYMLKDFPAIRRQFSTYFSDEMKERNSYIGKRINNVLGKYLRGAIVVAIIQGVISGTVLWIIGVNYALILGIMTAVLNFIPYIGLITSLVVAIIVASLSGDPVFAKVIGVIILYLSQKLLEATVLAPKIIGTEVGLHPVLLILCLLVFGYFLGFVGLLIAVPATALIVAGVNEWSSRRGVVMANPEGV